MKLTSIDEHDCFYFNWWSRTTGGNTWNCYAMGRPMFNVDSALYVGRTVRLVPLAVTGNWVVTAMAFIASVPSPIAIVNLSCISNYLPIEGSFHIWIVLYYAPFSLPFCKLSASLWFNCAPFYEFFNVSATEAVSNCDNSWLSFFSPGVPPCAVISSARVQHCQGTRLDVCILFYYLLPSLARKSAFVFALFPPLTFSDHGGFRKLTLRVSLKRLVEYFE